MTKLGISLLATAVAAFAAGTFHILDKWQFKACQVGTVTGRVWFAQGVRRSS